MLLANFLPYSQTCLRSSSILQPKFQKSSMPRMPQTWTSPRNPTLTTSQRSDLILTKRWWRLRSYEKVSRNSLPMPLSWKISFAKRFRSLRLVSLSQFTIEIHREFSGGLCQRPVSLKKYSYSKSLSDDFLMRDLSWNKILQSYAINTFTGSSASTLQHHSLPSY